jgi:hypothetical protein
VATSGTGGGFEKFCRRQTDISDASEDQGRRAGHLPQEGVQFVELQVAADALTVVTGKGTTILTCLTTSELKRLWEPAAEGKIRTWNQVRSTFPAESIALYGPGTFDLMGATSRSQRFGVHRDVAVRWDRLHRGHRDPPAGRGSCNPTSLVACPVVGAACSGGCRRRGGVVMVVDLDATRRVSASGGPTCPRPEGGGS